MNRSETVPGVPQAALSAGAPPEAAQADALAGIRRAMAAGETARALALAEAACEAGAGWPAELLRVMLLFRTGALATAVERGLAALPLSGSAPEHERFDMMRAVALCAMEGGRFDVALHTAQQALAAVDGSRDPGRLALGINALACCFERMGDPWQAERMMADALAAARESAQLHPLLATLNNLVAVQIGMYHLLRDAASPEEARAPLERALPCAREAVALGAQAEPFMLCFFQGNLGEVLLHLGLLDEAEVALRQAHETAQRTGAQAQAWRLSYSLAELDLLQGRPERAWCTLQSVLAHLADIDVLMTLLRVHHGLWRCASALGRTQDALHHLEQYLRLERERGLAQLRAQSQLFVTRAEAEQARRESRRDQLTQLGNRREAELRWPQLLAHARQHGAPLAVVLLDLDHFKRINDQHGHGVGDQVLVTLADILRENTRQADLVARVGGEEFLIVMPDTTAERAGEVCERLRQRVATWPWDGVAPGLVVTLSAGVSSTPPHDAPELTARADAALYRAKAEGRDRVVVDRAAAQGGT